MVPPICLALSTLVVPSIFQGEVGFTPTLHSFSGLKGSSLRRRRCQECYLQPHHGNEKTDKKGQCSEVGSDLGQPGLSTEGLQRELTRGCVFGATVGRPFQTLLFTRRPHTCFLRRAGFPFHRWEHGGPEVLIAFPGSCS